MIPKIWWGFSHQFNWKRNAGNILCIILVTTISTFKFWPALFSSVSLILFYCLLFFIDIFGVCPRKGGKLNITYFNRAIFSKFWYSFSLSPSFLFYPSFLHSQLSPLTLSIFPPLSLTTALSSYNAPSDWLKWNFLTSHWTNTNLTFHNIPLCF